MANKQKKKRTKKYQGADAKLNTPQVVRVSAEERSAFKEWWLVYGRLAKFIGAAVGILLVAILLIIGLIGIFTS